MSTLAGWWRTAALALTVLALALPAARAQERETPALRAEGEGWSERALELAAHLPVQEGGRVKPLATLANFTLLRLNGKRSTVDRFASDADGEPIEVKIDALTWLLDVIVDPDRAVHYPVFRVQDSAVAREIGLDPRDKKRSDRWTYAELEPGVQKLFDLAHRYARIEDKRRTPVEQELVQLAEAVELFLGKASFLDFARMRPFTLAEGGVLSRELGGATALTFADVVRDGPQLLELRKRLGASEDPLEQEAESELTRLLNGAIQFGGNARALALQPPDAELATREEWHTPGEQLAVAFQGATPTPRELDALLALQALGNALGDDERVDYAKAEAALAALSGATRPIAAARGEIERLDLEVTYYRAKFLYYALSLFVAAFLVTAIAWLRPNSKVLHGILYALVGSGTALVITAIVVRCLIRGRPPVSTLYETLLFVTAVGALIGLFIEIVNRRRIALWATAVLGMVGLFLANGYETLDAKDTMPSLVAVLDTNFWLATHVTTIVAGYAAGMFAALLGSIYLVTRAIRTRAAAPRFFQGLGRMTYGTLCFALILSLVGTILGGIWANDSWGRFWGWDPKENGALLICIAQVAILHARLGGYLRELGTAVAAAFVGTVVAFSWFGTNLLGVGLHSYGFTSGIHAALWTYYGVQWGICGLGLVALVRERATRPAAARAAGPDPDDEPRRTGERSPRVAT